MSKKLDVIAIVVSESAVVRLFFGGALAAEIIPEQWLLARQQTQLRGRQRAGSGDLYDRAWRALASVWKGMSALPSTRHAPRAALNP